MDANTLRRAFREYFVANDHVALPSAGLIPHHPRAPLFTNAGMNQFIPYFLGEEVPPHKRVTTIQKCVRIRGKHDDIELVGRDARHLTFFEMLGNWSFGDYFKEGAISFAWELLTERLGLEPDRLWPTVYVDDNEAASIWRDQIGLPAERIQRMGPGTTHPDDNFWEMGETGPCGPCSEIYYDRGPGWGEGGGPAHGSEDRYVEVWNLVFMAYDRQADGSLEPLPVPCIDTGAGLERLLIALEDVPSVWETDVLRPIIARAETLTGRRYGADPESDVALRIMADHARSVSFLINDGVFPSNEDRGYVLRRLIRRMILVASQQGVTKLVGADLVAAVVDVMRSTYPDLAGNASFVSGVVTREEERFRSTLRAGMALLDAELAAGGTLPGEVVFRLHDTHGFPVELTREVASARGVSVDEAGFERAMANQRRQSKEAARGGVEQARGQTTQYRELLDAFGPTQFVGYDVDQADARVLAVLDGDGGAPSEVFLDTTPFYAESGGQIGDTGSLIWPGGQARVLDTTSALPGLTRHVVTVEEGSLLEGQRVEAAIDVDRRNATRRNHTGTHLLHWALRHVLGEHVKQQGSLVAPDRLRFDFTHYGPLSEEEIVAVEDLVNQRILADEPVTTTEMSRGDAEAAGAIAFFEEKYGEHVRVVAAGPESLEFCGGTHVARLGMIGALRIVSEGSIGSNLRRIEAVTGMVTLERLRGAERLLSDAAALLRSRPDEVPAAVERKLADLRAAEGALRASRQRVLADQAGALAEQARADSGVVVARRDGLAPDDLRQLAVHTRSLPGVRTVVLGGSPESGRVTLVAAVAKGTLPTAPELVGPAARTVGGGGGGRNAELAVAGGRDATRLDEALDQIRAALGLLPS